MTTPPRKPSEAVAQGLCPSCLGQKTVYNVVEQRETNCRSCGGVGTLDALFALQCQDPDCPDHAEQPSVGVLQRLRDSEALLVEWFRWWRDSDEAPTKLPNSLHTRTATHLTIRALRGGRGISGADDL